MLERRLRVYRSPARGPLTFVVGSPRSGTTFVSGALAEATGMVDLGEVAAFKRRIPALLELPEATRPRRVQRVLEPVRWLGLSPGRRAVEQTPETSFVLGSVLAAYPDARALHVLRDGRDVVCSLIERGWLSAERGGGDDAGRPYGNHPRFWVEPERRDEFRDASEATRAAWAWRRYVEAVRSVGERTVELRYEHFTADPHGAAASVAPELGIDVDRFAAALGRAHSDSVGRWRRELGDEQVADVEREAGALLRELGYLGDDLREVG
ncbi:MAG TPA: sulfotransferase [Solirubrobacteraceae bacterium]|nr:sulfotransferase [Solirubrobacteraceae bacterium]